MAVSSIKDVKITGIISVFPPKKKSNWENELVPQDEREKMIASIGIESLRHVEKDVCTSDLCYQAAEQLINQLGWQKSEIEILVFVSQTSDYQMPATACILQNKLGLPTSCIALDVNLGCSGYVYGLNIISSLLTSSKAQKALLLVGDTLSKVISPRDRSVSVLFGDAGTATAVEKKKGFEMAFDLRSDGGGAEAIIVKDGFSRNPIAENSFLFSEFGEGIFRRPVDISMNGVDVFNFTVREVVRQINSLLEETATDRERIDGFIFHQANKMINGLLGKRLKVDMVKIPSSLKDYGNTSSATIPVTLSTQYENGFFSQRRKMVFSGFGVGLSWASVILDMEDIILGFEDLKL